MCIIYGGFLSHGGYPKSSKSLDSLDHFSIETYSDWGIPHLKKPPTDLAKPTKTIRNTINGCYKPSEIGGLLYIGFTT